MSTIYLCGGINKLSDSEAKDWREAAKSELSGTYKLLDPMRRDYRGQKASGTSLMATFRTFWMRTFCLSTPLDLAGVRAWSYFSHRKREK
jgi:hypothetical protein